MPTTVGWLLQILMEYQKHGEGMITLEDDRLVIRDACGAISLDLNGGGYMQIHGGPTDPYERPQAEP